MRENIKLATVAAICLGAGLAAPAVASTVADFAKNAGKVDGKSAVSSTASVAKRKGKLVATSSTTGRLPDNIIGKAPDANLLDGKDSTAFAPEGAGLSLTSGQTARGTWMLLDTETTVIAGENGKLATDVVTWPTVASAPAAHFIGPGVTDVAECPGTAAAPAATPGNACFFAAYSPHTDAAHFKFFDPTQSGPPAGTSSYGVRILAQNSDTTNVLEAYGTWAVTAP
jgi:hypothetical protein